jgi:hypothetical protein
MHTPLIQHFRFGHLGQQWLSELIILSRQRAPGQNEYFSPN